MPRLVYYHYYSFPDSVSSCTRVPQSRLCVSVRSETRARPESVSFLYSVISGFLVFSKILFASRFLEFLAAVLICIVINSP